jgi:hypothetical protein
MVSQRSRPAALTQADVDDLVRGDHSRVADIRRTTSIEAPAPQADTAGRGASRPADLSAKEIDAIRRTGRSAAAVAKRLAAAQPAETTTGKRSRSKATAPRAEGARPTTSPPGYQSPA